LPGLASNCDLPDLCLLSRQDHRYPARKHFLKEDILIKPETEIYGLIFPPLKQQQQTPSPLKFKAREARRISI
jgi:hypothetical protein